MSQAEYLSSSIKELNKRLNLLEESSGNLSHPNVQAILKYNQAKNKLLEYAGKPSPEQKTSLVHGKMDARIRDMEKNLQKLEEMILPFLKRYENE